VMAIIPPNMRKIPRRLTSRAKYWWYICPSWPLCTYVNSLGCNILSEQVVL
jgi:hypothetical protein